MLKLDENALICDFAETYHIFDFRALPARRAATLAAGLHDNSRIKLKAAGLPCASETLLLALAVDHLGFIAWSKTQDGQKNRNRPASIYSRLMGLEQQKTNEVAAFDSAEAFERAMQKIERKGASAEWRQN